MSQAAAAVATAPLVIGRYALFDELAAGGMATVHLGRLLGPVGFGRTVAVKRLHAHYLKDDEFITMFMDEARIVARIRHPNVVPMVDVVQSDLGLFLVMEYVHGESLSRLMRNARKIEEPIPPRIVATIMCGVLLGLHAAHDTKGADGQLLGVVHRDVSPQNIIVGADGTARVLDFGIAKAAGRAQITREGQIKGKLAYMAPEQIRGQVDRRTDVFAAAVVLWEMLAGRRLHEGSKDVDIVTRVVKGNFQAPSDFNEALGPELDAIVMRGLETDPNKRFQSARELALELERKVGQASPTDVSEWVERLGHEVLAARTGLVMAMELASGVLVPLESRPPPADALPADLVATPIDIPIHLDPLHTTSREVPSTSAVFAHAQTSPGAPVARSGSRGMDRTALAIMAISCALAMIGVALGAYALIHRAVPPAPVVAPPSATTLPRAAAASAGGDPSAPPSASATGSTSAAGAAGVASERPPARPPASAGAAGAATAPAPRPAPSSATAAPAVTAKPPQGVVPLPPPVVKKPVAKPSCEPPYTVDDVGHRHYKPECMGID